MQTKILVPSRNTTRKSNKSPRKIKLVLDMAYGICIFSSHVRQRHVSIIFHVWLGERKITSPIPVLLQIDFLLITAFTLSASLISCQFFFNGLPMPANLAPMDPNAYSVVPAAMGSPAPSAAETSDGLLRVHPPSLTQSHLLQYKQVFVVFLPFSQT